MDEIMQKSDADVNQLSDCDPFKSETISELIDRESALDDKYRLERRECWAQFAAAALQGILSREYETPRRMALIVAEYADCMLEEQGVRFEK